MEYESVASHNAPMEEFIGLAIKQLRTSAELTQEQFAVRLHSSASRLSNIERGKSVPSLRLLVEMAAVLQTQVSKIIALAEYLHGCQDVALKDIPPSYIVREQRLLTKYASLPQRDQIIIDELMQSMGRH